MPSISIIIPTDRPESLALNRDALKNQTFKDFEVIIGSPLTPEELLFDRKGFNLLHIKDDFKGGYWTLNRIYNTMFKFAKGELIVSLQDNIWVRPDGLDKFWQAYKQTGGVISGVGDQFDRLDEDGRPFNKVWTDPRRTMKYGTFYECNANDIEWNWAAIPTKAIFEAGGMDEQLDFLGYGGDQLQLMERIDALGYKTYLDQTNESFTLKHGRKEGWDENHVLNNGEYDKRKVELVEKGLWPRLNYLPHQGLVHGRSTGTSVK